MPDVSVHAIVLRRRDLGESDRRITLFTQERGRMEVVARGARKANSRLGGASEPLTMSTMLLAEGPRNTYITQAEVQGSFPGIRADYDRLSFGLAYAELFEAVTVSSEDALELYEMLALGLGALSEHPNPDVAFIWATVRLLELEGTLPSWVECVSTGVALRENPAWVSPMAGGYVSLGHEMPYPDKFSVTAETLIGLSKIGTLENPPPRMKNSEEAIKVLYAVWLEFAHKKLPAYRVLLDRTT